MHYKRLFLGLGGGALCLAISGLILVGGVSITPRGESMYQTDGPSYADITDLTSASQAVTHVKILSAGKSYLVPFDAPVVNVAPALTDASNHKGKAELSAVPAVQHQDKGILHTDFTVEVLDNIRGASVKKGDRLVVTQLGGTQADGNIASAENDALMQVGDQEVLFLRHDATTGKFFTTGGGQGRFKVQSNGTLSPVDVHAGPARLHTGKPVQFLKNAVQAVRD